MKKNILLLIISLTCFGSFAQVTFKLNNKGEIIDKVAREKFMKKNNYELLSAFDTIHQNPLKVFAIVGRNKKLGLINAKGEEVTPIVYKSIELDYVRVLYNNREEVKNIVVNKDGLYGVIDYNGKTVINCSYKFLSKNYLKGKKIFMASDASSNFYNFDEKGKLLSTKYNAPQINEINLKERRAQTLRESKHKTDRTSSSSHIKITFKNENKTYSIPKSLGKIVRNIYEKKRAVLYNSNTRLKGLYDFENKKIILNIEYKGLNYQYGPKTLIALKDGKYELFDTNGRKLLPDSYTQIKYENGFYDICKEKCAIYNDQLVQLTEFDTYGQYYANHGYCTYYKDDKEGLIDANGNLLLDFKYDRIDIIKKCETCKVEFIAYTGNQEIIFDHKGNRRTQEEYDQITPISYQDIKIKSGLIRTTKKYKIYPKHEYYLARKGTEFIILDSLLRKVNVPDFDNFKRYRKYHRVLIAKNKQWGLFDLKTNQFIIPMKHSILDPKLGYFYTITDNRKRIVYDEEGRVIFQNAEDLSFSVSNNEKGLWNIYYFRDRRPPLYVDYSGNVMEKK